MGYNSLMNFRWQEKLSPSQIYFNAELNIEG